MPTEGGPAARKAESKLWALFLIGYTSTSQPIHFMCTVAASRCADSLHCLDRLRQCHCAETFRSAATHSLAALPGRKQSWRLKSPMISALGGQRTSCRCVLPVVAAGSFDAPLWRRCFPQSLSLDSSRARREQTTIKLRKKKREESRAKRRTQSSSLAVAPPAVPGAAPAVPTLDQAKKHEQQMALIQMAQDPQTVRSLLAQMSSQSMELRLSAVSLSRKLLSIGL